MKFEVASQAGGKGKTMDFLNVQMRMNNFVPVAAVQDL